MGNKINPTSFRMGITETWKSKWFSKANYVELLREDVRIREYLETHLRKAGISRIDIERLNDGTVTVVILTAKPGLIIGRGGAGIEELKKRLKTKLGIKKELKVNIDDIKANEINLHAQVVANGIAEQLEKRAAFRRLMKQTLEQVMQAGAKGVKVTIGGRLNGAEIARSESLSSGKIPLHTMRANIDYAQATAHTTYGTIGIKIWIYRGDVFEKRESKQQAAV